ncbi:stamen-specific protein FIL1-like [Primulina huaijiensis]|uniref:stamen-specific protein FIL1-like n=1 Tax=Primulina huaijiensis TaxID=1492673 RepID=UPI003CC6E230
MAAMKSVSSLVLVIVLAAQSQMIPRSLAQTCSSSLSALNICAPFVMPGAAAAPPSPDCCNALQTIEHDCLCNTIRIASRMPAQCNLPPLTCGAN